MINIYKYLFILCCFFCFLPEQINAAEIEYQREIKQAETYLSEFDTLSARFTQLNPEGSISQGVIYISRPGNARWEYISPHSSLVIVNEDELSYWDRDLDQVTYADLPPSPINILLDKKTDFNDKVKVAGAINGENSFTLLLESKNYDEEGEKEMLTMVFSKNPFKIKRLMRTDSSGTTTSIELVDLKLDEKIDKELFIFKDPRHFNRKRKR